MPAMSMPRNTDTDVPITSSNTVVKRKNKPWVLMPPKNSAHLKRLERIMYRRNDAEGLEDLLKTVGKDERGRDGKRMGGGWSPSRGGLKTEFVERKSPAGRLMDDTKIILATTLTLPVSRPGTPMQEDEARAARSPASVRAVSGTAVGSVPEDDKESGFVITMPIFKEHTDIWNEIRMMGGVAQGTKGRAERENYPDFEEGDRALEDSRYMRDGKVVVDEEHLAGIQQLLEDEDMEGAMEERREIGRAHV